MAKLTRDVTKAECPWLDADLPAGTEVEKYRGVTYGCIGDGIAACFTQDGPFFEVPRDAFPGSTPLPRLRQALTDNGRGG